MDPTGELAELGEGGGELLRGSTNLVRGSRLLRAIQLPRGGVQGERHREQPLLSPVVQVPFDTPALAVAGLDDPRARRADLIELRTHLRVEPLVLDRHPGGDRGGPNEVGIERGIVDQRREGKIVALHERGRPAAVAVLEAGQLDRSSVGVDPSVGSRDRVCDLE